MSDTTRKRKVFKPGLILGILGTVISVFMIVSTIINASVNSAAIAPKDIGSLLVSLISAAMAIVCSYYALANRVARILLYLDYAVSVLVLVWMIVALVPNLEGIESIVPVTLCVVYIALYVWLMYALYQRSHDPFLNIGK